MAIIKCSINYFEDRDTDSFLYNDVHCFMLETMAESGRDSPVTFAVIISLTRKYSLKKRGIKSKIINQ